MPELTRRSVDFITASAAEEEPFFLYFSMTSPHEPLAPSEQFAGTSGIAPIADFIMETDWSVGEVVRAVDESGIADDTIIIFTADNGHSGYAGWRELVQEGHRPSGEFRGHKSNIWEGGHRVPMLVRWPGKVQPGTQTDSLVCLNDIFATLAELLNAQLPETDAEDSFSFLPTLADPSAPARDHVVNHSVDGEFALREGPWKLIYKAPGRRNNNRGEPCVPQLYNLDDDIAETNDLAGQHAERVDQMTNRLREIIENGRSRPGPLDYNDNEVYWQTVQPSRRSRW
jgi:arylsulfatase A-like enzyme